ncbi:MAG: GIY-YIG nuclease family protein [Minwuia sp.]|uniref:GIY-YIG nuclease family protein n=1 Tax=Minwuia sp. TaxID=2493630 RepID=UPI003A89D9C0
MPTNYFVYLLTNHRNGVFYCGVTNDLARRCGQHAMQTGNSFTRRYGVRYLAWYEVHDHIDVAISREKRIKRWPRAFKFNVIESVNPGWRDLSAILNGGSIDDCPPIPDPRTRRG